MSCVLSTSEWVHNFFLRLWQELPVIINQAIVSCHLECYWLYHTVLPKPWLVCLPQRSEAFNFQRLLVRTEWHSKHTHTFSQCRAVLERLRTHWVLANFVSSYKPHCGSIGTSVSTMSAYPKGPKICLGLFVHTSFSSWIGYTCSSLGTILRTGWEQSHLGAGIKGNNTIAGAHWCEVVSRPTISIFR